MNYITYHCYRVKNGIERECEIEALSLDHAREQLVLQDPQGGKIVDLITLDEFLEGLK